MNKVSVSKASKPEDGKYLTIFSVSEMKHNFLECYGPIMQMQHEEIYKFILLLKKEWKMALLFLAIFFNSACINDLLDIKISVLELHILVWNYYDHTCFIIESIHIFQHSVGKQNSVNWKKLWKALILQMFQ